MVPPFFFFPVAFAGLEQLLSKVSCLDSFPGPLVRERERRLLWSVPIGTARLLVSSAKTLGYTRQKGNSGASPSCCSLGP